MTLKDILNSISNLFKPSNSLGIDPRGVYTGPPTSCFKCGSLNISVYGSFDSDNIKTEEISCSDCRYTDGYSIA